MSKRNTSRWHSGKKPSDIVVEIGDRTFNCHRDALARVSRYFRDELRYGPEETSKIVIREGYINADAFENVLKFIYNEVPFVLRTTENVDNLLRAAEFLRLPLLRFYESIIQEMLPYSFMFRVFTFARTSGRERLWYHIADYVSLDLGSLCEAFGFAELPFEDVKLIIELCPLHEDIVVDAVVDWINHSREDRWRYFNELSRLGMMACVSSFRIKSMAKSILPDLIEVLSFLDNLKSTSSDKHLRVLWGSPIDKLAPRKALFSRVEVSIDQSIKSLMIQTFPRIDRMKMVALDQSHFYSLNLTLPEHRSNRRGILEFFYYTWGPMGLERNILPSPPTHTVSAYDYGLFQMCGLRSTKRIYLCSSGAGELFVYDCDANQWETLDFYFKTLFNWATMTACDTNNVVYLLGYQEDYGSYLLKLDPSTDEWSEYMGLPNVKKYLVGTEMCAFNGKLYMYDFLYGKYEIYDPKTDKWTCSREMPYANVGPLENVVVYGEELWLFATTRRLPEEQKTKKSYMAYIYRPKSNSWRAYPAMRRAMMECEKTAGCTGFKILDAIEWCSPCELLKMTGCIP